MENLSSFFISAPLSTLLTILSAFSLAIVFDFYGRKVFRRDEISIRALYFFSGLLFLGWFIWIVCLLELGSVIFFKILFWAFIVHAGLICFGKSPNSLAKTVYKKISFVPLNKPDQYFSWLLYGVLILYAILCLTVPTDADSLNYHLALPVDILNTGSLWFNKDYLCFRMAGFGEMINILGVANGCPQLGAFLQILALILVIAAFLDFVPNENKLLLLTAILAIPVLLFLLPNQKHQFTGILATSLSFFIVSRQQHLLTKQTIFLLVLALLLAAGIKYSFFISAALIFLLQALKWRSKSQLAGLFWKTIVLAAIVLGPALAFRWIHFDDPLSPFFEHFKKNPDPIVLKPYQILSASGSFIPFPINLILPASPGAVSTVIGISCLLFFLVFTRFKAYFTEILTIAVLVAAVLFTGQSAPRFFLEPVLWSLPLALGGTHSVPGFKYFNIALKLQLLILIPFIGFGIYSLGPSLLSNEWRETILTRSSDGYSESIWINKVVPPEATICVGSRSRAFLSRKYFPWEYLFFSSLKNQKEAALLDFKLRKQYKVDYLVLPVSDFQELKKRYAGTIVAGPKKFRAAVRNPLNSTEYEMIIYKLK